MDRDNMLSTPAIGRIADIVSITTIWSFHRSYFQNVYILQIGNNNALITSIAMASADNCKKFITAEVPCERAYQINKCIATEMKMRKIKLIY